VQDALDQAAIAEEADDHLAALAQADGGAGAGGDADAAADDAVGAEDAGVEVGDVHGAALALAVAGGLAKQLRHHQVEAAALGDAVAVAAVGAGDVVLGAQRGAGADGDGLHADVGVGGAADQAFHEELDDLGVEVADRPHLAVEVDEQLAGEGRRLRLDGHRASSAEC
jgi:hypothetical protein